MCTRAQSAKRVKGAIVVASASAIFADASHFAPRYRRVTLGRRCLT